MLQDVKEIVHRAISLYRADGLGMADYALESSGTNFPCFLSVCVCVCVYMMLYHHRNKYNLFKNRNQFF